MYSIKEAYNILKTSAISGGVSALGMAIAIPVLGLAGHMVKYIGDSFLDNYSLKNRFETAYSFNTPEDHKYYRETPVINGYEAETRKEPYLASPYATYGLIALAGLGGALIGGKFSAEVIKNGKEERKIMAAQQQRKDFSR